MALLVITNASYSQLKVLPSGYVGIATNTPISPLHVNGHMRLTGFGNTLVITPGNPGTEIGTSTDRIDFWFSSATGHHNLYAANYYSVSDSNTKINIKPLENGLAKLKLLKPCSYEVKTGLEGSIIPRLEYGFLSQEVARYFPHMTDSSKGLLLLDYKQITPILVEAAKEQQSQIELLQLKIEELEDQIRDQSNGLVLSSNQINSERTILLQNDPNPFTESTRIQFDINKQDFISGGILIFDLNGTLLKTIAISSPGKGEVIVNGSELNAGMFIYSLIVNNKEIDTKRMILLK